MYEYSFRNKSVDRNVCICMKLKSKPESTVNSYMSPQVTGTPIAGRGVGVFAGLGVVVGLRVFVGPGVLVGLGVFVGP